MEVSKGAEKVVRMVENWNISEIIPSGLGVKYDAVLVDACRSAPSFDQTLVCPVNTFLQEAVIRNIAQLITSKGELHLIIPWV